MTSIPLLHPFRPAAPIAFRDHGAVTQARFLAEAIALADDLPERAAAINLIADRYAFEVSFAAALLRGQLTLLPQSRASAALTRLARQYPGSYCITDGAAPMAGLPAYRFVSKEGRARALPVPEVPADRIAAVVFTSGSTGVPKAIHKTWGTLATVARLTSTRLGFADAVTDRRPLGVLNLVATVPHCHMYGLETSVMLPLQCGWTSYAGRPLFPEDIRLALMRVPAPRALITTPLHLRACLLERTTLPELEFILSATAPLSRELAAEAETLYGTRVLEVYGFAEAGSVATRRTVAGDRWHVLDGIRLCPEAGYDCLEADHLPMRLRFPDRITAMGERELRLRGRGTEQVNVGGRRIFVSELNHHLNAIAGVRDGVFFLPPDGQGLVTRLVAFVVAPGLSPDTLLSELHKTVDPVFLPRPIYLVEALPRNETGKLTHEALRALERACRQREDHGR